MKKLTMIALFAGFLTISLTSCRDQEPEKTQEQEIIEEMQDQGADIKVKDDGDKIKMETEDEKVKIKTDEDGDTKIKMKDKE
jgi:ABC-type enterochelin transport system substrate-binding protein